MQIHRNPDSLPDFLKSVVTIGAFDGVHTGHQHVLEQLKTEADKIGGQTVIITFDPHPRKIIASTGSKEIRLINTPEEKIELLDAKGIDHLVIITFTEAFSKMTAEEYVRDFLIRKFHPHTLIIGYDHRFGKDRKGDYHLLEELSGIYGYVLKEIPVHLEHSISVSSTKIRASIATGDFETANELLGYSFFFEGLVTQGRRLGKSIGFPTANLLVSNKEKIIPADGVYAVDLTVSALDQQVGIPLLTSERAYKGMMNIGFRPTVDGRTRTIEVNIFDFDTDIYGCTLRVYVKKFIRPERKFADLAALQEQLNKDRMEAMQLD